MNSNALYVFNVRDTFACNSSSTHSIIFANEPINISNNYDSDFGWDYFTVADRQGVADYLKATLYTHLQYDVHPDYIKYVVDGWVGESGNMDYTDDDYPRVDHQSVISLPKVFDESGLDKRFFDELKELLFSKNTLILGGNDNDENMHSLADTPGSQGSFILEYGNLVSRKDNGYWVLFDRQYGTKYRVTFGKNGTEPVFPTNSLVPELTDIKLTDFCDFGCGFCLVPGSLINIYDGLKPIEQIQIDDIVATYNEVTNKIDYCNVEQVFVNDYDGEIITIELENGSVHSVTPNHEVFTTNKGWIHADDLSIFDEVITI